MAKAIILSHQLLVVIIKKNLKNKKIFLKPYEGHFSICYNYINEIIRQVSE